MPRPSVRFTPLVQFSQPNWLGTSITDRKLTLSNGVMILSTGFTPLTDGRIFVRSGTILGRKFSERDAIITAGNTAATNPNNATINNIANPATQLPAIVNPTASNVLPPQTYIYPAASMRLVAAGDEQIGILLHDIYDLRLDNHADIVIGMSGNTVYPNFLPGWDTLAMPIKILVYQHFITVFGKP